MEQTRRRSEHLHAGLRFVVALIINPKTKQKTLVNALIDGGSSVIALSARAAKVIGLKGPEKTLSIKGFGSSLSKVKPQHCQIAMENRDGDERQQGLVTILHDPAAGLRATNWSKYREEWPHLQGLQLHTLLGSRKVDMIIGSDWSYFLHAQQDKYGSKPGATIATKSPLGWTVAGPLRREGPQEGQVNFAWAFHCHCNLQQPLPLVNPGDRAAIRIIANSSKKLANGKIQVAPLWKGEDRPHPSFKYAASD